MRQLFYLGFVVGGLSLASLAYALPPASDLTKRENRGLAPRRSPTPTPTPTYVSPTSPSSKKSRETIPPENRPSTIIVIDAGHGGFDRGGIPRQRVPEKIMTLDVAQRLRAVLEASGYRVVMTRNSDVFVPLGTRVAIANSYSNAIFICIHFNAAPRSGANGIETYFYSSESLPLASAIHYHVAGGAPTPNRGVRRRGFFVLRRTRIPAVLVECGFLTNATEAQYVQNVNYRQKLAEEIAAGIRGRSRVASSGSGRIAVAGTVPLQPFIDQTRVRDPDLSRSKRSKKSKGKSSRHRISSDTEAEKKTSTRKSAKKTSSESDDSGGSSSAKTTTKKASSESDDEGGSKKKSAKKTSSGNDDEGSAKKKSTKKASGDSDDSGRSKKKKSSTTQPEN